MKAGAPLQPRLAPQGLHDKEDKSHVCDYRFQGVRQRRRPDCREGRLIWMQCQRIGFHADPLLFMHAANREGQGGSRGNPPFARGKSNWRLGPRVLYLLMLKYVHRSCTRTSITRWNVLLVHLCRRQHDPHCITILRVGRRRVHKPSPILNKPVHKFKLQCLGSE